MEFVLEVIVAGGQAFLLDGIGGFADGRGRLDRFLLQREPGRPAHCGLLRAGCDRGRNAAVAPGSRDAPRMGPARAGVGFLLAGENPQQRGLAAAVGPDQADAVARAHLEGHPFQHLLGAESLSDIDDVQENHPRRVSERASVGKMERVRATQSGFACPSNGTDSVFGSAWPFSGPRLAALFQGVGLLLCRIFVCHVEDFVTCRP